MYYRIKNVDFLKLLFYIPVFWFSLASFSFLVPYVVFSSLTPRTFSLFFSFFKLLIFYTYCFICRRNDFL